jgi:hypothetical protein
MRRLSGTPILSRIAAGLVAAAMATTSLAPLARAQDAGKPADKPAPAKAEPDKKTRDAARKAFGEGKKAFDAGKYDKAYEGFKKANELIPAPLALYWMALSLDKAEKLDEATAAYQALLDHPDAAKIGDEKLNASKARYQELAARKLGKVNLTTSPAGAMVTVDGEAQPGETPMRLELKPGTHKLTITAAGHQPKQVELTIEPSATTDETVQLEPEPAATPSADDLGLPPPGPADTAAPPPAEEEPLPAPAPPEEKSMVPAYVTLGIAGAGVVVGSIFGIMALDKKGQFDKTPTTKTADDVERNALIADMAFGVAITLGVTGIVLLTSSGSEEEGAAARLPKVPQRTLQVAPYVSPYGAGAAARLTF